MKTFETDSQEIDAQLAEMNDWRGTLLATLRDTIKAADPEIFEEIKWRKPSNNMAGVPTWSAGGGLLCTGETYKDKVKLTFPKGASLPDPTGLFNSSLDGGTRRAIDFHEGAELDSGALTELIRAARDVNLAGKDKKK